VNRLEEALCTSALENVPVYIYKTDSENLIFNSITRSRFNLHIRNIAHTEISIPLQKWFSLPVYCTVFGAFAKLRKATISFLVSVGSRVATRFLLDEFS
jgi:hypothetical protein